MYVYIYIVIVNLMMYMFSHPRIIPLTVCMCACVVNSLRLFYKRNVFNLQVVLLFGRTYTNNYLAVGVFTFTATHQLCATKREYIRNSFHIVKFIFQILFILIFILARLVFVNARTIVRLVLLNDKNILSFKKINFFFTIEWIGTI